MPDWINVLIKGTYDPSFSCHFPLHLATRSFWSYSEEVISKMPAKRDK